MTDAGRPQDQGRPHRKGGRPSAPTATLLARYQQAMRDELAGLLDELAPKVDPQLTLEGAPAPAKRPPIADRVRLWDLAIKLGRELGTEVDTTPGPSPTPNAARTGPGWGRRRGRVDFG